MWYTEQAIVALQKAMQSVEWELRSGCGSGSSYFKACGLVDILEWQINHCSAQVPKFFAQISLTFLSCCCRCCLTEGKFGMWPMFRFVLHVLRPHTEPHAPAGDVGHSAEPRASWKVQIGHCHTEQVIGHRMCCGRPQPVLEKWLAGEHLSLDCIMLMPSCASAGSLTWCSYFPILRKLITNLFPCIWLIL